MNCSGYDYTRMRLEEIRKKKFPPKELTKPKEISIPIPPKEPTKPIPPKEPTIPIPAPKLTEPPQIIAPIPLREVASTLFEKAKTLYPVLKYVNLNFTYINPYTFGQYTFLSKLIEISLSMHDTPEHIAFTLCHEIAHALLAIQGDPEHKHNSHGKSFYLKFGEVMKHVESRGWIKFTKLEEKGQHRYHTDSIWSYNKKMCEEVDPN